MAAPTRRHQRAESGPPITRIKYRMLTEPLDVLYRIQRGLSGYVSYLAACEMNQSFSEYLLYEPAVRILTARGYSVTCEYSCPGFERAGPGDKKKIDLMAVGHGCDLAIEVKWAKSARISNEQPRGKPRGIKTKDNGKSVRPKGRGIGPGEIQGDSLKLRAFREHVSGSRCCLCVFGRKSHLEHVDLKKDAFTEILSPVYAQFGRTRYGCRIFELAKSNDSVE